MLTRLPRCHAMPLCRFFAAPIPAALLFYMFAATPSTPYHTSACCLNAAAPIQALPYRLPPPACRLARTTCLVWFCYHCCLPRTRMGWPHTFRWTSIHLPPHLPTPAHLCPPATPRHFALHTFLFWRQARRWHSALQRLHRRVADEYMFIRCCWDAMVTASMTAAGIIFVAWRVKPWRWRDSVGSRLFHPSPHQPFCSSVGRC